MRNIQALRDFQLGLPELSERIEEFVEALLSSKVAAPKVIAVWQSKRRMLAMVDSGCNVVLEASVSEVKILVEYIGVCSG